jgi:hypothetical protein
MSELKIIVEEAIKKNCKDQNYLSFVCLKFVLFAIIIFRDAKDVGGQIQNYDHDAQSIQYLWSWVCRFRS